MIKQLPSWSCASERQQSPGLSCPWCSQCQWRSCAPACCTCTSVGSSSGAAPANDTIESALAGKASARGCGSKRSVIMLASGRQRSWWKHHEYWAVNGGFGCDLFTVLKGCLTLRLRRTKELVLRWMSHCSWGEQSAMATILFEKTVRMKKRGSPNEIDGVSSTCRPDLPFVSLGGRREERERCDRKKRLEQHCHLVFIRILKHTTLLRP